MLESCVEENLYDGNGRRIIVIGEAVQFLQALLDLITEQHLHLEVRINRVVCGHVRVCT
jgi:hypothetical protein